ncbi:MAG: deoxycytidylate deaminase [Promethearchaeota archaeon]
MNKVNKAKKVEKMKNPEFPKLLLDWFDKFPLQQNKRPTWDEYFLLMAFIVSRRSSCLRKKVGAVIVNEKEVLSTGYNGAPQPQKNCLEIGWCYRDKHHIKSGTQLERCRASGSHAESNAIALAAKNGHSTKGATLYLYGHSFICNVCRGIIANAYINRVVHLKEDGTVKDTAVALDWAQNPLDVK